MKKIVRVQRKFRYEYNVRFKRSVRSRKQAGSKNIEKKYCDGYAQINNGTSKIMIHLKYHERELSRHKQEWIERYVHRNIRADFCGGACMAMTIST